MKSTCVASFLLCLSAFGATPAAGQQRLLAPDPTGNDFHFDRYGEQPDIYGDTLVVTSRFWGLATTGAADGRAYIYQWTAGQWELIKTLASPVPDGGFGQSPSLNGDFLAIGHRRGAFGALADQRVFLYQRQAGGSVNWGLVKEFSAGPDVFGFGHAVSVSGPTLALSSVGTEEGLCDVSIYERDQGGPDTWGQVALLMPSSRCNGGFGLHLSLDGDTLAVGYRFEVSGPVEGFGAVWIFERNAGGLNSWGEVARIDHPSGVNFFGTGIVLDEDTVAIGGNILGPDGGNVFIHERDVGGTGAWGEVKRVPTIVLPFQIDLSNADLVAGMPGFGDDLIDDGRAEGEGLYFRFRRDAGGTDNWGLTETVLHPEPGSGLGLGEDSNFGAGVAIDGNVLAVGDTKFVVGGGGVGAVYMYGEPGVFEVVDVIPQFVSGAGIVSDPEILAAGGAARRAAAADGVTRLLLRFTAPNPGSVDFSLVGGLPEDGGVHAVGQAGTLPSVFVPVVQTSAGLRAFAVYRVPEEFNRGGDDALTSRDITLRARFVPTGQTQTRRIRLVRPPVVLMHGLWSNSDTWLFPLASDTRFPRVDAGDYRGTNGAFFATNTFVPRDALSSTLSQTRISGIAVTQADYVGHSMGGLLGRIWTTHSTYERANNFDEGDIRKLVTLDTPHTGSPLATLLVALRLSNVGPFLTTALRAIGQPIDEGALDDLSTHSAAIDAIEAAEAPGHALVGIGGSEVFGAAPGSLGLLYTVINFFSTVTEGSIFGSLQHDLIVPRDSQEGGLASPATSVFGGGDGLHIGAPALGAPGNTGSDLYSARVIELLDTPTTSAEFETFPAPRTLALSPAASPTFSWTPAQVIAKTTPGLTITSPSPGAMVDGGALVTVTITAEPGTAINRVLLLGQDVAMVDDAAPFRLDLTVPEAALGSYPIQAIGGNDADDFFISNEVELIVGTSATLEALSLAPGEAAVSLPGSLSVRLTVAGMYSDGIVRDLTQASLGTSYVSADDSIATVSLAGVVTPQASGTVSLTASNGGLDASMRLLVIEPSGLIFSDGFESGDTTAWSSVQ